MCNLRLEINPYPTGDCWAQVSWSVFRSWNGKRKVNGKRFNGPVFYFLTTKRAR